MADAVFGRWGQVDLLCNNAGVFVGGVIWDRPMADFEFVLGPNLWGILHGIRSFVPRMVAQDTEGHVVNTASVAGLLGAPFEAPYAISKFAAFAATECLANDLSGHRLQAQSLGAVSGDDPHQHPGFGATPASAPGHRVHRGPEVRLRISGTRRWRRAWTPMR